MGGRAHIVHTTPRLVLVPGPKPAQLVQAVGQAKGSAILGIGEERESREGATSENVSQAPRRPPLSQNHLQIVLALPRVGVCHGLDLDLALEVHTDLFEPPQDQIAAPLHQVRVLDLPQREAGGERRDFEAKMSEKGPRAAPADLEPRSPQLATPPCWQRGRGP